MMAAIVLVGFLLRLRGIDFGLPALNDPDELMFELGAVRMVREATLNPGWFGHPATTTMELLAILDVGVYVIGHLVGWFPSVADFVQTIYHNPGWVILPGRTMIALFAAGTVLLTGRIARMMFDSSTGLVAAALLAVNPVHIGYSQIIRADIMACFFMLLCLAAAIRIARDGRWRDYIWASVWLGLAVASKWPFALTALGIAGAAAVRIISVPSERRLAALRLGLCVPMSVACLLLLSPYLLLDFQTVLRDVLGEAGGHHLAATGGPPWWNAFWYVRHPLLDGLGLGGFVLALVGLARVPRNRDAVTVIAPTLTGFFILLCLANVVWERWALPLLPLVAILASPVLVSACRWLVDRRLHPTMRYAAAALLVVGTLAPPALAAVTLTRERSNDTRQRASHWAREHVAAGSTVMVEQFSFDLLDTSWRLLFPLGDRGCVDARRMLGDRVGYGSIGSARGHRAIVDYGTLAADRRSTCRADYAIIAQYDRYAAEKSAFPVEYAAYRGLLAEGRVVATLRPIVGESSGPVVRILRFTPHALRVPRN